MKPGLYHGMDEASYHAHPDSLSVTGAKVLLRCPALYRWQRDHPVRKDVFDFGKAAHAKVLGVGGDDIAVIDVKDKRGKAWTEPAEAARAEGKTPITRPEAEVVDAMADRLAEHTLAMRLLSHGRPEVSAFCPDAETGVMRRGRFDWLGTGYIADYKTAASADPADLAGQYGVIRKRGYDQQAAWYLDLARDLGEDVTDFLFIAQEKEPPYLVTVVTVPDDDLWEARIRNADALALYRDCTQAGHWPGYLPATDLAVVSLTDQHYTKESAA